MGKDIVLAIDIEPSGRGEMNANSWDGTLAAFAELTQWRAQLEQQTGIPARFNWFLRFDPQIENTRADAGSIETACPELVQFLKTGDDFCGIHTHFYQWSEVRNRWFSEFSDPAWSAECLARGIAGFERLFGYRPQGSRFGDRWCSNELVSLLQAEGIRYELTLEPGLPDQPLFDDPYATRWLPDYRRALRVPYQPSPKDYLTPDSNPAVSTLWMVPITTTTPPRWVVVRRAPYLMKASRPLNLAVRPRALWRFLAENLVVTRADPLVFVLRLGDLASPRYLANFRYLAGRIVRHSSLRNTRFARVDHAIERFSGAR